MSEASPSTPETAAVVKAGEFVFREGERPGALFVVESGEIELVSAAAGGASRVARLGPGDVFGEDCAFGRRAAGYSARAVNDCQVIRVAASAFHDVVRLRPEVAAHVIGSLGRRLLEARLAQVAASRADAASPASPVPAVGARLVQPDSGTVFMLPSDQDVVVGRADPRTKFSPDIDLSTLDGGRSLSRRHAVIARSGPHFMLTEEARVANGTFVKGQRVQPGVPTAIDDGDEVSFGLVRMVFRTR